VGRRPFCGVSCTRTGRRAAHGAHQPVQVTLQVTRRTYLGVEREGVGAAAGEGGAGKCGGVTHVLRPPVCGRPRMEAGWRHLARRQQWSGAAHYTADTTLQVVCGPAPGADHSSDSTALAIAHDLDLRTHTLAPTCRKCHGKCNSPQETLGPDIEVAPRAEAPRL
jgi:hypothetical protein